MVKKIAQVKDKGLSTIEVGDALEDHVYDILSREVEGGRFYISKKCCRIYKKKGYYSSARRKKIIFDVSIEVRMPGQKKFSLLILIECKNYGGSVPVGEIEEFHTKLRQVTGVNVKGIFASSNSFQEGTRCRGQVLVDTGIGDVRQWLSRSQRVIGSRVWNAADGCCRSR